MTKRFTITLFTLSLLLTCSFMFKEDLAKIFTFKNLQLSEDGLLSGTIDLNTLDNYANQPIPAYITKDNSGNNQITDAGATLGRVLFYDKNLSKNNSIACASCHLQEFAFSDTAQASLGVAGTTGRHAMRLVNSRFADEVAFFWDERSPTLEHQTTQPIQDHLEMGFSGTMGDPDLDSLISKLQSIGYYQTLFSFVYGDSLITEIRMRSAMAQFIRSIQSFDAKYDVGRAQAPNEAAPFQNFNNNENQGKILFITPPQLDNQGVRIGGGAGCAGCHRPPEFDIDPQSLNNGIVGSLMGGTDLLVTRSPTLRDLVNQNGVVNGPMMHTGVFNTIGGVINHYDSIRIGTNINTNLDPRLQLPNGITQKLNLTNQERAQLVVFLQTLSGSNVYTDLKWSSPFSGTSLTVIPVVNVNTEAVIENSFKIYPNPVQSYLQIECNCSTDAIYSIYNLSGQLVQQEVIHLENQTEIRLDDLTRGVYMLQVTDEQGQLIGTEKIVKL